jgi:hypothetical protein
MWFIRSKSLWRWYINVIIVSLHIIHCCFYLKHNVSEAGFCLRLQIKHTPLGPIDRDSPYLRTGWWIMSRNVIFILMYRSHKLLHLIVYLSKRPHGKKKSVLHKFRWSLFLGAFFSRFFEFLNFQLRSLNCFVFVPVFFVSILRASFLSLFPSLIVLSQLVTAHRQMAGSWLP